MNRNKDVGHKHSHLSWVGGVGVAVGALLMIYAPSLKAVSSVILLFAGFHVAGALILFASLYVMGGNKVAAKLVHRQSDAISPQFDFGWTPGWTHGPWIASLALVSIAVLLEVAAPTWWPMALIATLFAASFFAGGLVTRASGRYEHAVLPMVDLLPSGNQETVVLDAGCGAGRTTIALGRAYSKGRIVAVDRFDSGYIEGGGRSLCKRNLERAGLSARVQIESGDLIALQFPDGSFDAVVSAHAVDHLGPLTITGLREIQRVLKPEGRFLLIVWVPGWTMFGIASVLSLFLARKQAWRKMTAEAGLTLADEGMFNGCWFALLKNTEA